MADETKATETQETKPATTTETKNSTSAPKVKKVHEVKSKSDVDALVSGLSKLLPSGAVVTVPLPIAKYNSFVDGTAKLVQDAEYDAVKATSIVSELTTTIQKDGITVHVKGVF